MKYLIWDFDGTMGYREGGSKTLTLLKIVQQALPELGITRDMLKQYLRIYPWHTPERAHLELSSPEAWWEALLPMICGALTRVGVPEAEAHKLAVQFQQRYTDLSHWRLFTETLSTLTALSALGWQHVVLSNHVPELPAILDHLSLTPHLAAVFNSAQTGYEKPHPQAFRNVLEWAPASDAIWMIGDNLKADIAGAAAQGIPGILVRTVYPEVRYCCADLTGVEQIVSEPFVRQT